MTMLKYNLEYYADDQGRRRVDLSGLDSVPRGVVYTSGTNPVYDIDMAVPSVYDFFLSHAGTVKFRLMNVPSDRCVTVNLVVLSATFRAFEICDDKGTTLSASMWADGVVLNSIPGTRTYLVSIRNYGNGVGSVMINWIKKG
jgi:hypothetical protein